MKRIGKKIKFGELRVPDDSKKLPKGIIGKPFTGTVKFNYEDIVKAFSVNMNQIPEGYANYQCIVSPSIYEMGIRAAKEKKEGFRRVGRGLYWGKCKVIKAKHFL